MPQAPIQGPNFLKKHYPHILPQSDSWHNKPSFTLAGFEQHNYFLAELYLASSYKHKCCNAKMPATQVDFPQQSMKSKKKMTPSQPAETVPSSRPWGGGGILYLKSWQERSVAAQLERDRVIFSGPFLGSDP